MESETGSNAVKRVQKNKKKKWNKLRSIPEVLLLGKSKHLERDLNEKKNGLGFDCSYSTDIFGSKI